MSPAQVPIQDPLLAANPTTTARLPPEIPSFDAALAHAKNLFPMPKVVVDARALISRGAAAGKIAAILGTDQTLAGRVVSLSNTAAFRGRMPIRDLAQAVARVGNRHLDELLIALSAFPRKGNNDVVNRLLPRLLTVAAGCRVIAGYQTSIETGTAFLTGLFLDMGQLLLAHGWPREYEAILFSQMTDGRDDVVGEEREWLGFDHAELGAALVKQWEVAQEVHEGVLFSHDLIGAMADGSPIASTSAAIAGLAEHIGRALHNEIPREMIDAALLVESNENAVLDLPLSTLKELPEEIEREAFALGAVFGSISKS